jgi:hypothetical protein
MSDIRNTLQSATDLDLVQIDTDLQLINRSINTAVTALNNISNAIGKLSVGITGPTTPASATAPGIAGTVVWDANFIYVAVGTNVWKRVALTTW